MHWFIIIYYAAEQHPAYRDDQCIGDRLRWNYIVDYGITEVIYHDRKYKR